MKINYSKIIKIIYIYFIIIMITIIIILLLFIIFKKVKTMFLPIYINILKLLLFR